MKTINKIAERQEIILQRWYEIVLIEEGIPIEYCPTPHILDAELMEFEMKKDLAEFLYSKLNCSYQTAYEVLDRNFEDERIRRIEEDKNGINEVFIPHPTSYNSSGNQDIQEDKTEEGNLGGRPKGSNNDAKQAYDKNYQQSKVS